MRLKTLSISLFTLGLTACASLPQQTTSSNQNVSQQATSALNSIYTQPNYNFNARVHSDINFANTITSSDKTQQKKLIEQYLLNQNIKLSDEQKNNMLAQLEYQDSASDTRLAIGASIIKNLINFTELQINGGVDLRQKRANLDFVAHYQDANLLLQYRMPFFVDLQQNRIYFNDLNPSTIPKKATANSYYIDFSQHQDLKKAVNWKDLLAYFKAINMISYESLIGNERVETLTPSATEKKQGAVKTLRLHTSVEQLLVESAIFEIINKRYVEQIIDTKKLEQAWQKSTQSKHTHAKNANTSEQQLDLVLDAIYERQVALAQAERADIDDTDKANEPTIEARDETKTSGVDCSKVVAQKTNFGTVTECYLQNKLEDNTQVTHQSLSLLTLIAQLYSDSFQQKFSQYNTGKLSTIDEFKAILAKHKAEIEQILPEKQIPLVMDVNIDKQGRLVSNNMSVLIDTKLDKTQIQGKINFDFNVKNYGTAKVELNNKASKAIEEHPWVQLGKSQSAKKASEDSLSSQIAESVYKQTKSYEKTYAAVFINLLSEQNPELLKYTTAQDLQEIALVYAYSYSDEDVFKITPEQHKKIQALEKKHKLHSSEQMLDSLGAQAAQLVENAIDTKTDDKKQAMPNDETAQLKQKFQTPEALFAHLYYEKVSEIYGDEFDENELKSIAKILAKAYMSARQGTFDKAIINSLTEKQMDAVSSYYYVSVAEMVEEVYPQ